MTALKNKKHKETVKPVLVITRIFKAPRPLVFAAWTQKKYMTQWSAPHGFTIPASKANLRAGGAWTATMRSPEGEDLKLGGVYLEVVPNERLVFTHMWEEDGKLGHETTVTVRLSDLGGKTKMIFRQTGFETASSRDGHQGGWLECFERLTQLLNTIQTQPAK